MFAYTISSTVASLFFDGKLHTVKKENSTTWEKLLQAIKDKDIPTIRTITSKKEALVIFLRGTNIYIKNNTVYNGDKPLHSSLTRRIIQMMDEGFDVQPMLKFLNNLMQNPSARAIEELYNFLEVNNLPITEDGRFLAYKRIRYDFLDVYSGTINNNIGQTVKIPRNNVDDDCRNTCSFGLHVCSLGYLNYYSGERLIAVLVNPRDVVSIPVDYNNSKMRVSEYEVHSELNLDTITEYNNNLSAVFNLNKSHLPETPITDEQEDEEDIDDWYENSDSDKETN